MIQKCAICRTKNIVDEENTCSSKCSIIYVKTMLLIVRVKKKYYQSPEQKEKRKQYLQSSKVKEKQKEYNQRPEVKKRQREYKKKCYQNPEIKERLKKCRQRPEVIERKRKYDQILKDKKDRMGI